MSVDYETALEQYFELKDAYDTKRNKMKSRIIKDDGLSKKQKRKKVGELKIKCISCKRNVGTIFELRDNNYSALCGDSASPCKLNIMLERGVTLNIDDEISKSKYNMMQLKENLVNMKLELVYGIKNEEQVEEPFQDIIHSINDTEKSIQIFEQFLEMNTDMKERSKTLIELNRELYELIEAISDNMKEFRETKNPKFIQEIVEMYGDEIKPTLNNIRENKYRANFVEQEGEIFHLIQNENTIADLEMEYAQGVVHSFIL